MTTDGGSAALLAALRSQREQVLRILDGLGDADLRRPVPPRDPDTSAGVVLDAYRAETAPADAIIAATPLQGALTVAGRGRATW